MVSCILACPVLLFVSPIVAFRHTGAVRTPKRIQTFLNGKQNRESISYEETGVSSKGLVSSLTGLVNSLGTNQDDPALRSTWTSPPPKTPEELMERIRDDYVLHNYLWTGDIDLAAFEKKCRFTDPTLSFEGTDQFVKNLNNLRPIVEALIEPGGCQSRLLQIVLNSEEGYVQSRWNMVGRLTGLPWKPMIDVIGRTKFWYRPVSSEKNQKDGFQVFFYDEEWEIPAGKALLQLITPEGTIKNTSV
jgi:hypothetical protein